MWTGEEVEEQRRLLMEHWDPIGIHDPQADDDDREAYWDEYDDYIPPILDHLESAAGPARSDSIQIKGGISTRLAPVQSARGPQAQA